MPYALSKTLNDVGALAQYRERQRMGNIFTVRRKAWVDNSVKTTKFAKKNDLVTEIAIESPGGGTRSDILGKFETQTQKLPHGGRSVVIPVAARKSKADIVPQGMRPKAFNFKRVGGSRALNHNYSQKIRGGVGRGALEVYEGDKRTVMIRNAQGKGVVLQRVGKGKKHQGMRVLFFLTPKVKLTANLKFIDTAKEAATHAKDFFAARFAEAMFSAKQ